VIKISGFSLAIAIPYSLLATFVVQIFTMQAIVFPEGEGQRLLQGADAIAYTFQKFGFAGYFAQTLPQLVIVFLVVFFALVLQGYLLKRVRPNA